MGISSEHISLFLQENMGFALTKCLLLVQLSLLCFTVYGEELFAVVPGPTSNHGHGYNLHPPTQHHHHHNHHHAQPPVHAAAPSPTHHHHHNAHPPRHAAVHTPAHAPAHSPLPHPHPHPHPPAQAPTPIAPVVHPHPPVHSPGVPFPRALVAVQGVVYCKSCKYPGVDTLLGASPLAGATVKLQCNNTKNPLEVKATSDKNGYFYIRAPKTVTNYAYHKCKVSLVSSANTACSKPSNLHGGISGGDLRPEKKFFDSNKLQYVLFTVGPFAFEPKCAL